MNTSRTGLTSKLPVLALLVSGALVLAMSCASMNGAANPNQTATPPKSGSELWAQNCRRCHNFRSPSEYSDAQWDVAMFHMRVRANLTGAEHESIRQFLKSSN